MSDRDPRVDPRPGDVLVWGALHPNNQAPDRGGLRIYVDHVGDDTVEYCCSRMGYAMTLDEWRKDMADAEVLHVAD